ncbi:MAG: NADH:quinone oxidoreductase, partial [Octadecabacter sp.]
MKDTAPKGLGIIAVAALFGLVALLVSYLVLNFVGFASCLIGAIVALITAIVLWLGWREPASGPIGHRDLSADANSDKAASYTTKAPSAASSSAGAPATAASFAGSATATAPAP